MPLCIIIRNWLNRIDTIRDMKKFDGKVQMLDAGMILFETKATLETL